MEKKYIPCSGIPFDEWRRCEHEDFAPTERQAVIMAAVAKAIDAGAYYSSDIRKLVAQDLGYEGSLEEGTLFSGDLYMARKALDAKRRYETERQVYKEMALRRGDKLGTLMFNDFKLTQSCWVIEVKEQSRQVVLEGKRGRATCHLLVDIVSIKWAIERAFERGKRKDDYQAFIASRSCPSTHVLWKAEALV